MEISNINVKMFGMFELECNGRLIDDSDSRSRKTWLLLAYLIFNRGMIVSRDDIVKLLWNDGMNDAGNSVKAVIHRLRTALDGLGEDAGKRIIISSGGGYTINPEIELDCDTDRFCSLLAETGSGDRLARLSEAIGLFGGEFLPMLSMEHWTVPIETEFHAMYINAVCEASSMLEEQGLHEQAVSVCEGALKFESYNEELTCRIMRCLLALGDRDGVARCYDSYRTVLQDCFGVHPEGEAVELFREAVDKANGSFISPDAIKEQLEEDEPSNGAYLCDYSTFKSIYRAKARLIGRSGDVYHVAVLSLTGKKGQALSDRSVSVAMDNLRDVLRSNLRSGDIVSRCSESQYVVMLPLANYENSSMVCGRLIREFFRRHPHSPADLSFSVNPLEPKTD